MNARKCAILSSAVFIVVTSIVVSPIAAIAGYTGNAKPGASGKIDYGSVLHPKCRRSNGCGPSHGGPDVRDHRPPKQPPDCKGGHKGANGVIVTCS